jgi:hypothetical protein
MITVPDTKLLHSPLDGSDNSGIRYWTDGFTGMTPASKSAISRRYFL